MFILIPWSCGSPVSFAPCEAGLCLSDRVIVVSKSWFSISCLQLFCVSLQNDSSLRDYVSWRRADAHVWRETALGHPFHLHIVKPDYVCQIVSRCLIPSLYVFAFQHISIYIVLRHPPWLNIVYNTRLCLSDCVSESWCLISCLQAELQSLLERYWRIDVFTQLFKTCIPVYGCSKTAMSVTTGTNKGELCKEKWRIAHSDLRAILALDSRTLFSHWWNKSILALVQEDCRLTGQKCHRAFSLVSITHDVTRHRILVSSLTRLLLSIPAARHLQLLFLLGILSVWSSGTSHVCTAFYGHKTSLHHFMVVLSNCGGFFCSHAR